MREQEKVDAFHQMRSWRTATTLRFGTVVIFAILTLQNYCQFHQHYYHFSTQILLQQRKLHGMLPVLVDTMDQKTIMNPETDGETISAISGDGNQERLDNNETSTAVTALMHQQQQKYNFEQETVNHQPRNRRRGLAFYEQEMEDLINRIYRPQNNTTNQTLQLDIVRVMGIGGVLEMEDGREIWCLEEYYKLWKNQQPFSGQPFLEWLDHPYNNSGSTEVMESKSCPRRVLNHRRFSKFNTSQIEASRIEFRVLHHKLVQAVFVQSQQPVPDGTWDIIWDVNKRLYLSKEDYIYTSHGEPFEYYRLGHCSVTHGRPVLFAGEVVIGPWGLLVRVYPESGHYRPTTRHTIHFFEWMKGKLGDPVGKKVKWMPCQSCEDYLDDKNKTMQEWEALFSS